MCKIPLRIYWRHIGVISNLQIVICQILNYIRCKSVEHLEIWRGLWNTISVHLYSALYMYTVHCTLYTASHLKHLGWTWMLETRVSDCLPRDVIVYNGCEKSTWYLCHAKHNIGYPYWAYDNTITSLGSLTFYEIIKLCTC